MRAPISQWLATLASLGLLSTAEAAVKPPEITPDAILAGMEAAPQLVAEAGLDCRVSDARLVGVDDKTGATFYEVACAGGEGFVIAKPKKAAPPKPQSPIRIYTCLEAAGVKRAKVGDAVCGLSENANPKAGIAAFVAKRMPSCQMTDARVVGHNEAATVLEIACQDGAGYIIQASYPLSDAKPATVTPCAGYTAGMQTQCALTGAAGASAYLASIVARSGRPCQVGAHRYVGLGPDGDAYFEVACADGQGFMLDVDAAGDVYPTPCAEAYYIGSGCTLTKPRR